MAAFPSRNWHVAQRHKIIAAVSALIVAAGSSGVTRAQGTEAGPYGLSAFWTHSDLVARSTLLCLAIMLIGSAYVLLRRLWDQQIVLRNAQTVNSRFWTAPNLYEAVRSLESQSAFRAIAEDGLEAATHREGRLTDRIGADEWIAMSLQRSVAAVNDKLQQGLKLLETVGSAAPFVGLFGTVWGIHRALTDAAAEVSVAVAVGAALVMTVVGLAVAVLAMLGVSWLSGRNETAIAAVNEFADHVQAVLLSADVSLDTGLPSRRSPVSRVLMTNRR
ncbi:MAG TPA: MotA/TolQ/ExbB proton channel family protein [Gammaproteobacteria bacterium]|nr:MotA/TolQ/ExbB proton channel family protein [Gammaproteobacteria bacterium]